MMRGCLQRQYLHLTHLPARCLSQGLISNPSGTKAERKRFVEALTRQIIDGLDI